MSKNMHRTGKKIKREKKKKGKKREGFRKED